MENQSCYTHSVALLTNTNDMHQLAYNDRQDCGVEESKLDTGFEAPALEPRVMNDRRLFQRSYHHLYIRSDVPVCQAPIAFEDGMDYLECEQYYASLNSHEIGGSVRRPSFSYQKSARAEALQSITRGALAPCLQTKKSVSETAAAAAIMENRVPFNRRTSFSGITPIEAKPRTIKRSLSHMRLQDCTSRVTFSDHVSVATIYAVSDYSADIQSTLWMTRSDIMNNMREAMYEQKMRMLQALMESNREDELYKPDREHEHRNSVDSVVTECFKSFYETEIQA
jgi:hypothetical protein